MSKNAFHVSFVCDRTGTPESIKVSVSDKQDETQAVSRVQKLMKKMGWEEVTLCYDGAAVPLRQNEDLTLAAMRLYSKHMTARPSEEDSFTVEIASGASLGKAIKDTLRLANNGQRTLTFSFNNTPAIVKPGQTAKEISKLYSETRARQQAAKGIYDR